MVDNAHFTNYGAVSGIHFKLSVKNDFFLIKKKKCFLDIQIAKATQLEKCLPKKFPEGFGYINIDFIWFQKYFYELSEQTDVFKKYHL